MAWKRIEVIIEDLEGEIWKDIPQYAGLYQASNLGRVKRLARYDGNGNWIQPRLLKKDLSRDGYYRICLTKDKKEKNVMVHRLVLWAFVPIQENKPHCNHINGIKTDNTLKNLEWCTPSENWWHAWNLGLISLEKYNIGDRMRGGTSPQGKLVLNTETGIYYNSAREAAILYNLNPFTLAHKLNPKRTNLRNNTPFIYC